MAAIARAATRFRFREQHHQRDFGESSGQSHNRNREQSNAFGKIYGERSAQFWKMGILASSQQSRAFRYRRLLQKEVFGATVVRPEGHV